MKEIGSEFHINSLPNQLFSQRDGFYTLSGRTCIDIIIRDIKKTKSIKKVYMPAYCCDSMIIPFLQNDISVDYYDMDKSKDGLDYYIDLGKDVDILYVNNYFGYENTLPIDIIKRFKEKDVVILYDQTHSLFMNEVVVYELADYCFCSIRKWLGVVTGGIITKGIKIDNYKLLDVDYWQIKADAMLTKAQYLDGNTSIEKSFFINAFNLFNHQLAENYINKKMDDYSYTIWKSTDFQYIYRQRKSNANYLHEHIKNITFITNLTECSCPLFVPIFFKSQKQRDAVRKDLIKNDIFCPIHWPKNQLITQNMRANKLFETELSLICDQRYNENDMKMIVNIINQ